MFNQEKNSSPPIEPNPVTKRAFESWLRMSPIFAAFFFRSALRAAGLPASDPVFAHARVFVERCQNFDLQHPNDADGGFFFFTTEADTNWPGLGPIPLEP